MITLFFFFFSDIDYEGDNTKEKRYLATKSTNRFYTCVTSSIKDVTPVEVIRESIDLCTEEVKLQYKKERK